MSKLSWAGVPSRTSRTGSLGGYLASIRGITVILVVLILTCPYLLFTSHRNASVKCSSSKRSTDTSRSRVLVFRVSSQGEGIAHHDGADEVGIVVEDGLIFGHCGELSGNRAFDVVEFSFLMHS